MWEHIYQTSDLLTLSYHLDNDHSLSARTELCTLKPQYLIAGCMTVRSFHLVQVLQLKVGFLSYVRNRLAHKVRPNRSRIALRFISTYVCMIPSNLPAIATSVLLRIVVISTQLKHSCHLETKSKRVVNEFLVIAIPPLGIISEDSALVLIKFHILNICMCL